MAKEKAVNYTEQDVAVLRAEYSGQDNVRDVEALSQKLNKTPASVRAKLASLGLYKAAEKGKAEGEEKVTKTVLAMAIGAKCGLAEHEVEGLSKAPKAALDKILMRLV